MTDLGMTIAPKSDQLNADDLIAGPITITITGVRVLSGDQPVLVHYDGDNGKPFKPCKGMRRVMVNLWGSNGDEYVGRSMTLYCDPEITFGKTKMGGIRISHMSHIDKPVTIALTVSRARRKPYTVEPLIIEPPINIESEGLKAANSGTDSLKAFWDSLDIPQKRNLQPLLAEWKKIAEEVTQ